MVACCFFFLCLHFFKSGELLFVGKRTGDIALAASQDCVSSRLLKILLLEMIDVTTKLNGLINR